MFWQKWFKRKPDTKSRIRQEQEPCPDMDPNFFLQQVTEAGLRYWANSLYSQAQKAIGFELKAAAQDEIPLGKTRVGGRPDVSPQFQWPTWKGKHLAFLAQINLEETAPFDFDNSLPDKGMLYFFYECEEMPWGFDPQDKGCCQVLYDEGYAQLIRAEFPPGLEDQLDSVYTPAIASLAVKWTLPEELALDMDDDETDSLFRSFYSEDQKQTYLLGFPQFIQNDAREECASISRGVYRGDGKDWQKLSKGAQRDIAAEAEDWILLFQLDSAEEAGMMWGDAGKLYFMIRKDDLAARRFEKVWLILQCY